MAVISTKTSQESRKADTTENEDKKKGFANEGQDIDIFTTKGVFEGDVVELDPTEDAWKRSALPHRGLYFIKSFPPKQRFTVLRTSDDKQLQWWEVSMESKIVECIDPELDNTTVFPKVSTYIGRGKNLSTAGGWIIRTGYTLPKDGKLNHLDVATVTAKIIKQEPVNLVLIDWSGWSEKDKRVVCKSMIDFPVGPDGLPMDEFTHTANDGTPEQIKATLKVRFWCQKKKKEAGGSWDVSEMMNVPSYANGIKTNGKPLEASSTVIQRSVVVKTATPISNKTVAAKKKEEPVQQVIEEVVEAEAEQNADDDSLLIIEE